MIHFFIRHPRLTLGDGQHISSVFKFCSAGAARITSYYVASRLSARNNKTPRNENEQVTVSWL